MSTIAPGRLNDVQNAADFVTLSADNFEILSEEIYEFTPTYENGSPNTRNGPPTATTHATGELYPIFYSLKNWSVDHQRLTKTRRGLGTTFSPLLVTDSCDLA